MVSQRDDDKQKYVESKHNNNDRKDEYGKFARVRLTLIAYRSAQRPLS